MRRGVFRYVLLALGIGVVIGLLITPLPTTNLDISRFLVGEKNQPEVDIIFGGDMIFDRYIRQVTNIVGGDYIFSCVDPVILEVDTVVANLEGPITNNPSVSIYSEVEGLDNYTFTFPPETAQLLKRHNIGVVNLGNNHIANFGVEGIDETKQYLNDAGVEYFGAGSQVLKTEINGIPFAFISYNEFGSESNTIIYDSVAEAQKEGRIVVVYAHWGEEYVPPPERVKQLARSFVDAGASIVVGSHPHIVQESERYKDVSIYYSLGNFIFDQYFDEEVSHGLLLQVAFDESGVKSIKEINIELLRDGRTCPVASSK